ERGDTGSHEGDVDRVPSALTDLSDSLERWRADAGDTKPLWTSAPDRVGEGLDRERLREACLDMARGVLPGVDAPPASSALEMCRAATAATRLELPTPAAAAEAVVAG
ncbi:unnamed protein product, partial [Laminaria digitata]